jgi:hypothetical protein
MNYCGWLGQERRHLLLHRLLMKISLDDLRQAHSAELYRLYLTIGRMLDDPQRVLQVRQHLHLGMNVNYLADDPFGPLQQGRVIELRATQAAVEDHATQRRWVIPYTAIVPEASHTAAQQPVAQPAPRARREEFFVGDTVGFTDKHLRERVGTIVRLNEKTASIACDDTEGHWRVSYGLLRRIVNI